MVDPQKLYWLQQFPKVEPTQVLESRQLDVIEYDLKDAYVPAVEPHIPSVETFLVPVAVADAEVLVPEAAG